MSLMAPNLLGEYISTSYTSLEQALSQVITSETALDTIGRCSIVESFQVPYEHDSAGGKMVVLTQEEQLAQLQDHLMARLTLLLGKTPPVRWHREEGGLRFHIFVDHIPVQQEESIYRLELYLARLYPNLDPVLEIHDSYGRRPSLYDCMEQYTSVSAGIHFATTAS